MAKSSRSANEPITVYGIKGDKVTEIDRIPPEIMPETPEGIQLLAEYEKASNNVEGVIFSQGRTNMGSNIDNENE